MKKITVFIIFIVVFIISCKSDDESISTKDFLIGEWEFSSYSINEVTPTSFTDCQEESTLTITLEKLIFNGFSGSFIGGDLCDIETELSLNYNINNDLIVTSYKTFKINLLTVDLLKLQHTENNNNIITIYNR